MITEDPPIDYFLVFCKGLCGTFWVIAADDLAMTISSLGYKSLDCFRKNFHCADCQKWLTATQQLNIRPS